MVAVTWPKSPRKGEKGEEEADHEEHPHAVLSRQPTEGRSCPKIALAVLLTGLPLLVVFSLWPWNDDAVGQGLYAAMLVASVLMMSMPNLFPYHGGYCMPLPA